MVLEKLRRVEPPQPVSHIRHVIKFAFSCYNSGREVEELLDGSEVASTAAAVDRQTVTDVRDGQGSDYLGEGVGRQVVTEMG